MRRYPNDAESQKDLERLNAQPWQVDMLKKNPEYVYWGNFEDYMSGGNGWTEPLMVANIQEGGLFDLDEYNELVHFYFQLTRKSVECIHCKGSNLNAATKELEDTWYSYDKSEWAYASNGKRYNSLAWRNHLTEVEVEALVKAGRLGDLMEEAVHYDKDTDRWYKRENSEKVEIAAPKMPTPEAVNEWNRTGTGHDTINRWIAVEARAKHLGVYGECEHCEQNGYNFTEPAAKVGLQLWYLHPRKGASRGVYINEILEEDVPTVIQHLKDAKQRNHDRFSNL